MNAHGPAEWANLSPDYHLCYDNGNTSIQSPINIPTGGQQSNMKLTFHSASTQLTVRSTGHSLQAGPVTTGNYMPVCDGSSCTDFPLIQFHFHTPSEHTVDRMGYAKEAHFVHKSGQQLAVVAVMLNEQSESSAAHPLVDKVLNNAPDIEGDTNSTSTAVNPYELLPSEIDFYYYSGSLTTPPCSEGVEWFVMKEPVTVSTGQVVAYEDFLYNATDLTFNNRPLQGLNGRDVYASDD